MEHLDLLKYALHSMAHRSLRSWLTILGIVIGIGAIVILISLAQGIDQYIRGQMDIFGANYVQVIPGSLEDMSSGFGPPTLKGILYDRDVEAVGKVAGVRAVSGIIMVSFASVEYRNETYNRMVYGLESDVLSQFTHIGLESGMVFREGDVEGLLIGNTVAHDYFKKDVDIGSTMLINGETFRVRGIIKKAGDIGGDFDEGIYMDPRAARNLMGEQFSRGTVFAILAITEKNADIAVIAKEVESELMKSHKVREDEKDFTVMTAESTAQSLGAITGLLSLFLGGVAAISLVVGGVGVANSMFTSVLERTREIGVLKSVGAPDSAIREIFLYEAAMIGIVGGVLGVLFGLAVSWLLGEFGVPSSVSGELLAFAMAFSVGVGVVSGYVPARNASRLQPVDALRYE
ncbi:MAG: ABC transporter permease [Candidatus Micrarchaeota archaeon]